MGVILQIINGPYAGHKTYLLAGQVLQVGRTEWADFSIPSDTQLGDVHFSVQFANGACLLKNLNQQKGTLVNGKRVSETAIEHGDQIQAGQTAFRLVIEGSSVGAGAASNTATIRASTKAGFSGFVRVVPPTAAEICVNFSLDADAAELLNDKLTPREYVDLLTARHLFDDVIRFMCYALPKPEAIWWACLCVRKAAAATGSNPAKSATAKNAASNSKDQRAVEAAERWLAEPSEDNRRAAAAAAEATNYDTAAGFAAAAAGWSGGSLAPPEFAAVPPSPLLTAQAVGGALRLASIALGQARMVTTQQEFLATGIEIADGKNRWEEKK